MLAWLGLLATAASPAYVYHVDLSRAALALEEGKQAQQTLRAAREKRASRLQQAKSRLLARRGAMSPQAYAAAVDALNAEFAAAEAELDQMQVDLLGPMTAKFEQIIAGARTEADVVVVLDDGVELVRRDRLCDRTAWLVERYRGGEAPPTRLSACRVRGFVRVRADDAVKALPEAETEARRLDALQAKRQETLQRLERALSELERTAAGGQDPRLLQEIAAQRQTLDQQFLRFQGEIRAEETAARTRLDRRLRDAAARAAGLHRDVLFVVGPALEGATPQCDGTAWVVQIAGGEGDPKALPAGCRDAP